MGKPRIAVFSGPKSTIANAPSLVTSNKGRLPHEKQLPGDFDHLVAQYLYEPVKVRIRKYSALPLEEESKELYHDDGNPYFEVELTPEDGPYLLPYMARRHDGSFDGVPFEHEDLQNPDLNYGGRQFFYPDASRLFEDIDRSIAGRGEAGEAGLLSKRAEYDFIRALPPGGYVTKGEVSGVDYFPYRPYPISKDPRRSDLARATNVVCSAMASGAYDGGLWLESSATLEENLYWLSLLVNTPLPLAGVASQRTHGLIANDGDRNIIDAVDYIISGKGDGLGAVGILDEQIFASREMKKSDNRPGGYKATGGHGGILGTVSVREPLLVIYYRPAYRHTTTSDVNLDRLPDVLEFQDMVGGDINVRVPIKDSRGMLIGESIPSVHMVKYGIYMEETERADPDNEVDIMARIAQAQSHQSSDDSSLPKLHGLVYEGMAAIGSGTEGQARAIDIAAFSGMPIVRVGRGDPAGPVPTGRNDLTIEGSNLDANKARILLMASMLKLGRLPKAQDPRHPTYDERRAVVAKISEYQNIFDTH